MDFLPVLMDLCLVFSRRSLVCFLLYSADWAWVACSRVFLADSLEDFSAVVWVAVLVASCRKVQIVDGMTDEL